MRHTCRSGARLVVCILLVFLLAPSLCAQAPPSDEEVANLLRSEPMSLQNWNAWRPRLRSWLNDHNDATTQAFYSAHAFVKEQLTPAGDLVPQLAGDGLAWYLLGSAHLRDAFHGGAPDAQKLDQGERALRRSLELEPNLASAHLSLGLARMSEMPGGVKQLAEAEKELAAARRLAPDLEFLDYYDGLLATKQNRGALADRCFRKGIESRPRKVELALALAEGILQNPHGEGARTPHVEPLVEQFPQDGRIAALHALALAFDGQSAAAGRELRRSRRLGTDPGQVFPQELVDKIDSAAGPWLLLSDFGYVMLGFVLVYALVMAAMAGAGFLLAQKTRGSGALHLLGVAPEELVSEGQVARAQGETALARLYALAIVCGLLLFYVSIPFLLAGLLACTALLLYGIFLLPRIPIKLVVLVVIVGLGCAWAVLKSLFSRPSRGSFGIAKKPTDCPMLYKTLTGVAERVDTRPVDEVYLAPGSSISVHQDGRGPFGLLGVKKRVLTLGVSTLHYLSVAELQSILAHEYAHFSHQDTFYNRFIYQVSLSIQEALTGMGQSGGTMTYINPFFWFLYLYHRAFTLLSAGYSRSREFLADRMAAGLYGSDVFATALSRVSTDGTLFEMTIYDNIGKLLDQNQSFINMYSAFRAFRDEQLNVKDRDDLYQKLLDEKESAFATHPTFRERLEAVAPLPRGHHTDERSAMTLFEQPEEIEKELTEFLTAYMHHVRQLQAQAAASA